MKSVRGTPYESLPFPRSHNMCMDDVVAGEPRRALLLRTSTRNRQSQRAVRASFLSQLPLRRAVTLFMGAFSTQNQDVLRIPPCTFPRPRAAISLLGY